jgi:hypothetical protein
LDESSSRTRSPFGGSDGQTGEGQSQNGRLIRVFNRFIRKRLYHGQAQQCAQK